MWLLMAWKSRIRWFVISATLAVVLLGVSASAGLRWLVVQPVSIEDVFGTYVASYPFGTVTVMLNRDGTFVQQVVVYEDPPPASTTGNWEFDPEDSDVWFNRYLPISDGFGRLSEDWRTPVERRAAAILPVRRRFFSVIVMGSGEGYPYYKQ